MVPAGEVKEEVTPATPVEVTKEESEKVKETVEKKEPEAREEVKEVVPEKQAEKPKEEVPVEVVKEEQEKVKEMASLPSAPTNVSILKVTADSIKVGWEAPGTQEGTSLKGYVVAVRDAAKKKFKDVGKVDAKTLTFKVKKLKEGHEYFVKVYAESEAGLSEMAAELDAPVKVGLPQAQESSDEVDAAKVKVSAPEFTQAPQPSTVTEGETIKLSCQLKGEENATVSWSRNGKPLKVSKKDKRMKIGYDSNKKLYFLEIACATLDNAGEYAVTASSDGGQVTSMVAMVTVEASQKNQKPTLPQAPEAVSIKEGEDIKISCIIIASPEPEVKWSKDGKSVTSKDDTRVKVTSKENTYSLRIKRATGSDSGEYTVAAVNSEGIVSHAIPVSVAAVVKEEEPVVKKEEPVAKEEEPIVKEEEPVAKEEEPVAKKEPQVKEVALEEDEGPEFTSKPEPIVVEEKQEIVIVATIKGTPSPSITWSKDSKPLKPSERLVESRDGDKCSLRIPTAMAADSGEYTCTINNAGGSSFCTVIVTVEEVESEVETTDKDKAIMEQLSAKIAEAKKKLSKDGGEVVFEKYTMLGDYVDKDTKVSLKQGEVVEVMDAESPHGWLVRKHDDKSKICYVPVELLAVKEEGKKGESSDEEEDKKKLKEQAKPFYMAVTDHRPSDTAGLALTEGQIVEVLDWSSADHWLCRLKDDPSTQGLVLPSYLVVSTGDNKLDTRTPQELFREEVIRIKDPAQEAVMKRRYALKDMWESEREYVRDLTFAMDTYYKAFDGPNLPKELVGKKAVVFATLPDIFTFHKDKFHNELLECPNDAKSIGETFLRNRDGFQNYVTYLRDRDAAERILSLDSTVTFLKELKAGMGKASDSQMALPQYLRRPWKRIDEYISLLKGFIKYSRRAEDDCTQLEEAVKMFLQLRHQADDLMVLQQISGFAGSLDPLGPVLAHDDFTVWDGATSGSGRERHLFLFEDSMMVTKKQSATKPGEQPKFTFKQLVPLSDLALNRLEDTSAQFALYSTKMDKRTFQAKSVEIKNTWCDLLAKYCKQYDSCPELQLSMDDVYSDNESVLSTRGYETAGDSDTESYYSAAESEPEATRPTLLAKLKSVICHEGETVKFECEVSGEPAPTVTWLHNGQTVSASASHKLATVGSIYSLTVMKADASAAGDYVVKVTNVAGETESSAKLDVQVEEKQLPEFTSKLGKADVLLGGEAKLQCKISGKPEPDITWCKDGKEIVSGDRIKFLFVDDESQALLISDVQEADMGTYKCRAVNKVGEATCSTTLNITDLEERKKECAPQFVTSLSDTLIAQDNNASFVCQILGYPQPDVIWQHNKKELKASGRHVIKVTDDECVLTLTGVTQNDAGTYTCKLKNKVSHVKSSAVLTVGVIPTLVTAPQNVTANVNGEVEWTCQVAGLPRPKVTWLHADKEITASDKYELHESDNLFCLKVKNIDEDDAGLYLCRVANDLGVVESSATMSVTSRAKFVNKLQDVSVVSGGKVTLSCDFTCDPRPSVTWLLKGEELKESDSYVFSSDATSCSLCIPVARPGCAGVYTCHLGTAAGAEECSAEVTVVAPPVIVTRFSDVECFHAERVELVCRLSEPVKGQVSWMYNRRPIAPMERIKIEQEGEVCRLVITMAMASDRGEYICKVTNDAGEATCSATLFVMDEKIQEEVDDTDMGVSYKPRFVKRFRDQDAVIGSSARLVCKTIGEPAPHVKWLKDGIPVAPTDNVQLDTQGTLYSLSIATVTQEDAGTYECVARNKAGDDTCSAVLTVDDVTVTDETKEKKRELTVAPDMPFDKPQLTELEDNVIRLTWPAASLPPGAKTTPIRYIIERKDISHTSATWESVQTTEDTSVDVRKFDPTKDYLYRLRAENDFGLSDPSMSVSYYGKHITEINQQMSSKRESRRQKSTPPPVPREKPHVFVGRGGESVDISWQSVTSDVSIYYTVERRCPPSRNWLEVATNITDTSYTMTDYQSEKDYMLRVRAGNDYGVSDPSPPTTLFAKIDATVEKKKKDDYKSKVKPRTVWDKPEVVELTDTSVTLSWKSSSLPDYAVQTPITYTLEQRVPPNFEWTRFETDLAETQLKVTKFNRDKDVYFRVKAANEYGTSEPSMPVLIRRREVVQEEAKMEKKTKKEEGKEREDEAHKLPPHKRIPPAFIGTTDDTQYGVEGYTLKVVTTIQGTPRPTIIWYHGGEKLEMGGRYNCSLSDMGQMTLEITHFSLTDVGEYKVHVENAFGAAAQIIQVGLADPPTFLEPMKDQIFHLHRSGKLECRVHGIPYPTVQFKKDWRVVADSHRLKVTREDYEHWTMNIGNVIHMDEGLYECIAENVAGKVYSSATVRVTGQCVCAHACVHVTGQYDWSTLVSLTGQSNRSLFSWFGQCYWSI
ncbi:hypothetical protein NP493_186g03131 [Ridgeia piscesae]|uniref:Obscurin-like n=1 Tax=Ridgeia piscesae TaxID=27915 RepID=A0AAD9P2E0_RIDPI|nr:hypothetical protein NP493_186g03131 [Ridgeia piscesae]